MTDRQPTIMDATGNETREQGLAQRIWRGRVLFAAVLGGVLALTVLALLVLPVRYLATGSVIVAEQELGNSAASALSLIHI